MYKQLLPQPTMYDRHTSSVVYVLFINSIASLA